MSNDQDASIDEQVQTYEQQQEQMALIKAKTMYEMVEDVPGDGQAVGRKVMFLSNAQCSLLANSRSAMQRMLRVFELPPPKLVINLLRSLQFSIMCNDGWEKGQPEPKGTERVKGGFVTFEDERRVLDKIDALMAELSSRLPRGPTPSCSSTHSTAAANLPLRSTAW